MFFVFFVLCNFCVYFELLWLSEMNVWLCGDEMYVIQGANGDLSNHVILENEICIDMVLVLLKDIGVHEFSPFSVNQQEFILNVSLCCSCDGSVCLVPLNFHLLSKGQMKYVHNGRF